MSHCTRFSRSKCINVFFLHKHNKTEDTSDDGVCCEMSTADNANRLSAKLSSQMCLKHRWVGTHTNASQARRVCQLNDVSTVYWHTARCSAQLAAVMRCGTLTAPSKRRCLCITTGHTNNILNHIISSSILGNNVIFSVIESWSLAFINHCIWFALIRSNYSQGLYFTYVTFSRLCVSYICVLD